MQNHMADILAGTVTKTNVIGIRKAINALQRHYASRTAAKLTATDVGDLEQALTEHEPRVVDPELHASGLKLLQDRRYRKRLEPVKRIIARLESFHLIGFDRIDRNVVPVYRARGAGGSFIFRNIPWQSGGNGPQVRAIRPATD